MKVLTMNGWGQPPDGLNSVAPDARYFDYSQYSNLDEAMNALQTHKPECVIGWSLGGQLAARAIAGGVIISDQLVLIAAPFQYVASEDFKEALPSIVFDSFSSGYQYSTQRTVNGFAELVARGDRHANAVKQKLSLDVASDVRRWQYWLKEVGEFSCNKLDFSNFPPTLIMHGKNDAVVSVAQAIKFAEKIPDARLEIFADCGHAPHMHDIAKVKKILSEWRRQ